MLLRHARPPFAKHIVSSCWAAMRVDGKKVSRDSKERDGKQPGIAHFFHTTTKTKVEKVAAPAIPSEHGSMPMTEKEGTHERSMTPSPAATEQAGRPLKRLRKAHAAGDAECVPAAPAPVHLGAVESNGLGPARAEAAEARPANDLVSDRIEDSQESKPPAASAVAGRCGKGQPKRSAKSQDKKPARARQKADTKAPQTLALLVDMVSEASEDDGGAPASSEEGEEEDEGQAPPMEAAAGEGSKPVKMMELKYPSKQELAKLAKAAKYQMEGVGTGALAAAKMYAGFDAAQVATWPPGKPVPYGFLADTFEAIAGVTKRLEMINFLVATFRAILATTPADLVPTVYLCTNKVAPAHEGVELGIGDATLIKVLASSTGRSEARVKSELEQRGDLGLVAASARATQRTMFQPAALTVTAVFRTLKDIASTEGKSSQDKKMQLITKLLVAARQNEAGYLIRCLQGKLRIGLAEQSVLVALAHAVYLHNHPQHGQGPDLANSLEAAAQAVKRAYSQCPSFDVLIPSLLERPLEELGEAVQFTPGVPIKPMLAKPTAGVGEVLDKFGGTEFTVEYKYDGERAQVHLLPGGIVRIYSRNSENNTSKYPDVAAILPQRLTPTTQSAVLDCEAVAWDRAANKILPFQVLTTRARKDVKVADIKVQVCLFAFDCLSLNGQTLLERPLSERRAALYGALTPAPGELQFALAKVSRDVEELELFLNEAVAAGTEGLIVKTLDSTYEPSRRSLHWLKLKKDYLAGCGDTFDTVVLGAWFGKGKRVGVFGSYLLGIYNPDEEEFQTICKIGTGFSEELLTQLSEQLRDKKIDGPRPYYRYGETLVPDVWFEPKVVWEVKAADLSISPVHRAALGLVDPAKGISIRFPRLVRQRDDKAPEDATSAEQVADMFRAQALQRKDEKAAATIGEEY